LTFPFPHPTAVLDREPLQAAEQAPEREQVSEPKPSRKRLWATIGITAGIVVVLAGLIGGLVTFHATADRYHRQANAETARANRLDSDLSSTREQLVGTQKDLASMQSQLNSAQADLTRSKDFANKASAVGAQFDQCVQDVGTFLERSNAEMAAFPYGYDPTLSQFASDVGAECGSARAAFYALGIGTT